MENVKREHSGLITKIIAKTRAFEFLETSVRLNETNHFDVLTTKDVVVTIAKRGIYLE